MRWRRVLDAVFPHIEPLSLTDQAADDQRLIDDEAAIAASTWRPGEKPALDEAQRVTDADMERVRTAEGKATTYLAVLAALVPIIITLQAVNRIRVTHEHLLRAFGTFLLLLLLDPLFHLAGFRNAAEESAPTRVIVERLPKAVQPPATNCPASPADAGTGAPR